MAGSAGKPIVLEVDGPSHFTHNTHRPLGSTRLRRQLLKAQVRSNRPQVAPFEQKLRQNE